MATHDYFFFLLFDKEIQKFNVFDICIEAHVILRNKYVLEMKEKLHVDLDEVRKGLYQYNARWYEQYIMNVNKIVISVNELIIRCHHIFLTWIIQLFSQYIMIEDATYISRVRDIFLPNNISVNEKATLIIDMISYMLSKSKVYSLQIIWCILDDICLLYNVTKKLPLMTNLLIRVLNEFTKLKKEIYTIYNITYTRAHMITKCISSVIDDRYEKIYCDVKKVYDKIQDDCKEKRKSQIRIVEGDCAKKEKRKTAKKNKRVKIHSEYQMNQMNKISIDYE